MTVSSRTPEGVPHRCPICGKMAAIDPASPAGDSTCPSCGHLLWWFRDRLGEELALESSFRISSGSDSLDLVNLVIELEDEFGVTIPDEEAERFTSLEDAVRYVSTRMDEVQPDVPQDREDWETRYWRRFVRLARRSTKRFGERMIDATYLAQKITLWLLVAYAVAMIAYLLWSSR